MAEQLRIQVLSERILYFIAGLLICYGVQAQQLVLPGDHPDPSVVRIGNRYWASATTSNWAPAFPLLESKDLVHWKKAGHVFTTLPSWADYYFWAPELSYENGKVYVYYAAHKKNGNLCVGVASADRPEGPYKDHGPLICQEVGSIDAFPMRDEKGKLYLVWKEDANSVGKPTPIWAMQMNEERTALIGEKIELFRNTAPWERNLVEGVSMTRHGDYFYAFYAAAGCCGRTCTYGVGIARSKSLPGPWEKYEKNPVMTGDQQWTCPGHGTPIEKEGHYYFLYHAYDKASNVYTGRQGLLIEYKYTPDGWIEFVKDENSNTSIIPNKKEDNFRGSKLSDDWQWSVFDQPRVIQKGGELYLSARPQGAFLAESTLSGNYYATVKIYTQKSTAATGLAAIGDENNLVGLIYSNGKVSLLQRKNGKETELASSRVEQKEKVYIKMQVEKGSEMHFYYSSNGSDYILINEKAIEGAFLPPWDRAVRIGIMAKGAVGEKGVFDRFQMVNK